MGRVKSIVQGNLTRCFCRMKPAAEPWKRITWSMASDGGRFRTKRDLSSCSAMSIIRERTESTARMERSLETGSRESPRKPGNRTILRNIRIRTTPKTQRARLGSDYSDIITCKEDGMNKAILIGRLTRDPDIRYNSQANGDQLCIARFTLAVDRRIKAEGQPNADFISCVCFGKSAEFAEKYLIQGTKIAVTGHIQTGSYTNKDGVKIYTTDVMVEEMEFCEKKTNSGAEHQEPQKPQDDTSAEGFMTIPENAADDLPFKNKK